MSRRFKESSERSDEGTGTGSLLSRLSTHDLKSIKVAIRRHNVSESTSPVTVQRALEDPSELVIHRREGEGQHPIFDRRGIVVNVEKNLEERIVLKSPIRSLAGESPKRSRSRTYSDREASTESYRSRSQRNRRGYSRSPSAGSRKDPERKPRHSKEYGRGSKVSPARSKQKVQGEREKHRDNRHAEGGSSIKRSNRSVSPNYKRSETDRYDSRNRMPSKERYYRERSPKPGTSKGSKERERSSKEKRDIESYRKEKYKGSPRRLDYRESSPKRYDKNRSRSHSPRKLNYKHGEREKYTRSRASPTAHSKRYSVSPHSRRRSRSPYSRKRSPSPHSKRHSRSPHVKRTPPREERGFRASSATGSKARRRSGSPYDRDKDYPGSSHHGSHGRPAYSKRRSRSPYPRRHSRSPPRTESAHKYRKHSRSPSRRELDRYHRPRSRSPTHRTRKHSKSEERGYDESSADKDEYGAIPPNFEYYGAEGFWIPGPMPRPGFLPRGVIPPPMAVPRGMIRPGPPYIIPRPYMPLPPHLHQFRPRFPVTYSRPFRPRITAPTVTTTDTGTTVTTISKKPTTTSTVSVSTASAGTSCNPIVEEPVSESENVELTVQDKP